MLKDIRDRRRLVAQLDNERSVSKFFPPKTVGGKRQVRRLKNFFSKHLRYHASSISRLFDPVRA
jgi:hypothetical protein